MSSYFVELDVLRCSNAEALTELFDRKKEYLTSHWLGRKVVALKACFFHRKGLLKDDRIVDLFEKSLISGAKASSVWLFWNELKFFDLCVKDQNVSIRAWRHVKGLPEEPSIFKLVLHRLTAVTRLIFRTLGYYFGFDPRYLFGSRIFWDLEQRFNSLKNLSGLCVTVALGTYQAFYFSAAVMASMPFQISLWAQVLVVVAVAALSILALGSLFYRLGKWLGGPPLELWKCRNLTFEMSQVDKSVSVGREKEISQIISHFGSANSSMVMIRGQAGVGKTFLVKEFARSLARDPLPPGMNRPQLFLLNAAQMDGSNFTSALEKLTMLKEAMEGYEKDLILAIDECHLLDKACIEQLKQWKDDGLRFILLTNSEDGNLKKAWQESYESLLSHVKSSTISLEGKSKDFLEQILEHELREKPGLYLDEEAKQALLAEFENQEGAPRLLNLSIQLMDSQEKAFQNHQEAILRISQEISLCERQMESLVEKGMWVDLDEKARSLQEKIDCRQRLISEARERDSFIKLRQTQTRTYHELRGKVASWAQKHLLKEPQKKNNSGERRFLSSIQKALSRVNPQEKLPFASMWNKGRIEGFLSLTTV